MMPDLCLIRAPSNLAELVLHDAVEDDFGNLLKPTLESDR